MTESPIVPRLHLRVAGDFAGWIADGRRRVTVAQAVELNGETDAAAVIGATRLVLDALPEDQRGALRAELLEAVRLVNGAASSELLSILRRIDRVAGMRPSAPDLMRELAETRQRVLTWREGIATETQTNALLATVEAER
jgi:hypothetical protein